MAYGISKSTGIAIFALHLFSTAWGAPPSRLSETGLYRDIAAKAITVGIETYVPQYPLWSDGAVKRRWIQLPRGSTIDTADWDRWVFPVGTTLWKEFSFPDPANPRRMIRVETRLLRKTDPELWEFASYRWDRAESDAHLVPDEGALGVHPTGPQTSHAIPSVAQCLLCHRRGRDPVLGFEAIQLSDDRDPLAPHGEPLVAGAATLTSLIRAGRLTQVPPSVTAAAPKFHGATPTARAALGYLHANCGSCHHAFGTASHVGLDLRHTLDTLTAEEEPAVMTSVNKFTTVFQIPGENRSLRVSPGKPEKSALLWRMKKLGQGRMPQIGTDIVDAPGAAVVERWIRELAR